MSKLGEAEDLPHVSANLMQYILAQFYSSLYCLLISSRQLYCTTFDAVKLTKATV